MGHQEWSLGGETWIQPTVSTEWPSNGVVEVKNGNQIVEIETVNRVPKGRLVHMSSGGNLVPTYEGDPRAIGTVVDFTEHWDNDGKLERMATVQMIR